MLDAPSLRAGGQCRRFPTRMSSAASTDDMSYALPADVLPRYSERWMFFAPEAIDDA